MKKQNRSLRNLESSKKQRQDWPRFLDKFSYSNTITNNFKMYVIEMFSNAINFNKEFETNV